MLLHFKNVSFDDDLFEGTRYERDLDLISFQLKDGISTSNVTLNLVFKSPQDARRAYFTMLHTDASELDLRDIEVEWPSELMERIMGVLYEPELFQKESK